MIKGCTRKTPTPMPLTNPAEHSKYERNGDRELADASHSVATRKPVIDATAATDRSMPPVSMVNVWQPARIASGIASRNMVAAQLTLKDAGSDNLEHDHQQHEQPINGIRGRSRNSARNPATSAFAAFEPVPVLGRSALALVICAPAQLDEATDHDNADQDDPLGDGGVVRVQA